MYLTLDSNLYSSVVLAIYVGTELLLNLFDDAKEKKYSFKAYCLGNWQCPLITLYWMFTHVLEAMGGRADNVHKSMLENIVTTFAYEMKTFVSINVFVLITEVVIFVLWLRKSKKLNNTAIRFILYIGLQCIYLIFLNASVEPIYMTRTEVVLANYFYVFLAMFGCLNELVKENRNYRYIPLILLGTVGLICIQFQPSSFYMLSNYSYISYEQCEAVMDDLIDQVKTAEAQGQTEMTLVVPKFDSDNNWPFLELVGNRITTTFYRHKVVDTEIYVTDVIFFEEKNEEFGIGMER